MGSRETPEMTAELFRSYSQVALRNADELLAESIILRDHKHMARAYFLAVSSIEEVGKGLICFDAQNRNLSDPAVCAKLKADTESHKSKINYALGKWALNSADQTKALKVVLGLIVHLLHGREPSMYSELRANPSRVQTPREIVPANVAWDCVRLAGDCLANAHRHVCEENPLEFTPAQNRLFAMRQNKIKELINCEDFWWYFISRLESGQPDLAEAVLEYDRNHVRTGKLFHPEL